MRSKLSITFIFLLTLLSACAKKNALHLVDAGMLAAYDFDHFSEWIYKDSATGELDTFRLSGYTKGQEQKDGYMREFVVCEINVHAQHDNPAFSQMNFTFYENYCILGLGNNRVALENNLGYSPVFAYPVKAGDLPTVERNFLIGSVGRVIAIYPTYVVNGVAHANVAEINYKNLLGSDPQRDDWFYLKERCGFVKLRFNHPQDGFVKTLELIQYY
jgi:hypothetical protein